MDFVVQGGIIKEDYYKCIPPRQQIRGCQVVGGVGARLYPWALNSNAGFTYIASLFSTNCSFLVLNWASEDIIVSCLFDNIFLVPFKDTIQVRYGHEVYISVGGVKNYILLA